MKRFAILTAALFVGGAFVFAVPASAEDVNECPEAENTQVCVQDFTKGDKDEACDPNGSGSYKGRTAGSASTSQSTEANDPSASAEAGGQKTCEHSCFWWGCRFSKSEKAFARADVCLEQGDFRCETGANGGVDWNNRGIHAIHSDRGLNARTPAGDLTVGAQWSKYFRGNTTDVEVTYCGTQDFCEPSADAFAEWDMSNIEGEVGVCLEGGSFFCETGTSAHAFWGQGRGGCTTKASVDRVDGETTSASQGCPAGSPPDALEAPDNPNPGWGTVTPDVPELLEEHLPEDDG